MGAASASFLLAPRFPQSDISLLSSQVVPGTGAQSVTADRDTRRSNYSDEDEVGRQQGITEY